MKREQCISSENVWEHYTIQCADCLKWRLIPTKDKYEEIRESIIERPFICENAREWKPDISCEDESDIKKDRSQVWAMDKPKIPKTPPGWQRIIRRRAIGETIYADVYYIAPSNKILHSMLELNRYIAKHQERVSLSQFSFEPPEILDENYNAKRQARVTVSSCDETGSPLNANSISEDDPNEETDSECSVSTSPAKAV